MFALLSPLVPTVMPHRRGWVLFVAGQLALALAFLLFLIFDASAQDAVPAGVDLGPVVTEVLVYLTPTLATAAALGVGWVVRKVGSLLNLKIDESRRAAMEQAFQHAVAFALSRVGDRTRGGIPTTMHHSAVAYAVEYAQRAVPDAIRHFGKTPEDLAEMAETRLEPYLIQPTDEQVVSPPVNPSAT